MEYLKIAKWEKWQNYRIDRGQPPWIKIHRNLLRNQEWHLLTDTQKGQLVSMWMLAADKDGQIPADPVIIRRFCGLGSPVNLQAFVDLGFIDADANVTPKGRHIVSPDAEESRVDIRMADANKVLDYLNKITGRGLLMTRNIEACLKREKCSVKDCKLVIDYLWASWSSKPEMVGYVDHTTPWRPKNFAGYLDKAKEQTRNSKPSRELPEELRRIAEMEGE